jgi:two-component system NtrC family sensor kinase
MRYAMMMNKVTKASFARDVAAMNEGLLLGLVRQHELTEVAQLLNTQLQAEIIARRKAEGALVRSEKLASVGRMAAVLAHEINNPLDAAMNSVFLAMSIDDLAPDAHAYLLLADAELKRIAHITRQTLGFYREASAPVNFEVASLLGSVVEQLRAKIAAKKATVTMQCEKQLRMTAFEGELRQVFSNLVLNSLDALPEDGKVVLRAATCRILQGKRGIRFTVSDNGNGMTSTVLRQIFEPFFTTKGDVGNGLGLWVSKQIIQKHGGSIQVRSSVYGPSQGTTVSVLMPELDNEVEAALRTL